MASPLDKTIAHNLRDLVTKMQRRLRRQICNPEQLSIAELNVLSLLTGGEHLPSELCAQLHLSSQYMSQVLNRLGALGYITRKDSIRDKRKSFALLTGKGKAKVEDSRQQREEWLATLISRQYSSEEKKTIQKAVELLLILPDL